MPHKINTIIVLKAVKFSLEILEKKFLEKNLIEFCIMCNLWGTNASLEVMFQCTSRIGHQHAVDMCQTCFKHVGGSVLFSPPLCRTPYGNDGTRGVPFYLHFCVFLFMLLSMDLMTDSLYAMCWHYVVVLCLGLLGWKWVPLQAKNKYHRLAN